MASRNNIHRPPKWLLKILSWFCSDRYQEIVVGDISELYHMRVRAKGKLVANLYVALDVLRCLRPGLLKNFRIVTITNQSIMFKSYLKISARNLVKNSTYSLINIGGLVVGFTACIIIALFVNTELSYDRYHQKSDKIYRLVLDLTARGEKLPWAIVTGKWGPIMLEELPSVANYASIIPNWGNKSLITHGDKKFYEQNFGWGDSGVTEMFDFEFEGLSEPVPLARPNTIIISKSVALRYFGTEDALGKILRRDDETDYTVTGVYKEIPSNSHFHLDLVASLATATAEERDRFWGYTYVELVDDANPDEVDRSLIGLVDKNVTTKPVTAKIYLQPLTDIHLQSDLMYEFEAVGNQQTVYIIIAIGFLVMGITGINFINISTAFAIKKMKETGIRKIIGAGRIDLTIQTFVETVLVSLMALLAAYGLALLVIPQIQTSIAVSLLPDQLNTAPWIGGMALIVILVGIFAGAYPAFQIASIHPGNALRGGKGSGSSKFAFRKVLVVMQFSISIFLISGSVTAYRQLSYMQNKDLGLEGENVVGISIVYAQNIRNKFESFKNEALKYPGVQSVARISNFPMELTSMWVGTFKLKQQSEDDAVRSKWFTVDHDFIKTFGIKLQSGRDFSLEFVNDTANAVILNQAAVDALGVDNPIGQEIELVGRERVMRIVGVVDNFHFASLHSEIEPLLIFMGMGDNSRMAIKLDASNLDAGISGIEKAWYKFEPERPMEFQFLNSYFNEKYNYEKTMARFLVLFTILAIVIAALGLYGLTAYVLQLRLKEISVRKILGATNKGLFTMISSEFLKLVLIALVIALPLGYMAIGNWLSRFPYRIDLGIGTFLLAGLLAIVITLITISYRSIRAASCNPVDTLRQE